MKPHHLTRASLAVSAAVSGHIVMGLCTAKGATAGTAAFAVMWFLLSVAGLFAEFGRENGGEE